MSSKNHEPKSNDFLGKPAEVFSEAVRNMIAYGNKNEKLANTPKFSIDALLACFPDARKETFLTEKPFKASLRAFLRFKTGKVRDLIPQGVRITLAISPCSKNGLELPSRYFNDDSPEQSKVSFPYFVQLSSSPSARSEDGKDSHHEYALGMGNLVPAPLLRLYPPEILDQCYFDVAYQDYRDSAISPKEIMAMAETEEEKELLQEDLQDFYDYLYLKAQMAKVYECLQRVVLGRMK